MTGGCTCNCGLSQPLLSAEEAEDHAVRKAVWEKWWSAGYVLMLSPLLLLLCPLEWSITSERRCVWGCEPTERTVSGRRRALGLPEDAAGAVMAEWHLNPPVCIIYSCTAVSDVQPVEDRVGLLFGFVSVEHGARSALWTDFALWSCFCMEAIGPLFWNNTPGVSKRWVWWWRLNSH